MTEDDTRKRSHSEDEKAEITEAISSKRAALSEIDNEKYTFKLLCYTKITGLIIGRQGATLNHIIASTGARIKLSTTNELFPFTNDRIIMCKY